MNKIDNKIKPIFKYIGGKTWLRDKLRENFNICFSAIKVDTYVEPFCGGLGAFLNIYDILITHNIKKVVLSDINSKLINFYNTVLNNRNELINEYDKIENNFIELIPKNALNLHTTKDKLELKNLLVEAENYYKKIRTDFNSNNQDGIKEAASLLFLQNHCFNGIYRENSKGGYNTPFNWEVIFYSREKISKKINDVYNIFSLFEIQFLNESYTNINFNSHSFYYLDPPYLNKESDLENNYNKSGFNIKNQLDLINKIKDCYFVYSNHNSPIITKAFNSNIVVELISRKNIVSASIESRKNDKVEILVRST